VSVRSAKKCPLNVELSKEAQLCSSGSERELNVGQRTNLYPRTAEEKRPRCTISVQQVCFTKRDLLRDEIREVGRGLSLADTENSVP
jgi:hypothetical protein